ncbi:acrosin-like [Spea bombifrons]|uniref:acrosin-like n=1 Tax=Spea bombifrons TaxID=233779 RepID=UPI00234A0272|nr:acrosin-like [Spea bombifrons]
MAVEVATMSKMRLFVPRLDLCGATCVMKIAKKLGFQWNLNSLEVENYCANFINHYEIAFQCGSISMKLFLTGFIIWVLLVPSESSEVCGNRPLADAFRGSRVVGGKDAEPGTWPWAVSVQEDIDYEYYHLCGGVVLNNLWVLTAAHCFKDRGNDYHTWRLVFGANQLSDMGKKVQIRTIRDKIQHEKYNPETERNDITLLRLSKPLAFDEYTQPACLPAKQAILSKTDDCYIAGWGILEEASTETSDILQEAPVNLIPVERCNRRTWYNGALGDYNLCAGYEQGGIDSCQGDSGGPLMCKISKAKFYTVVGIASWGSGCGQKQSPGVYTSTQYFLEWISKHIYKDKKPASKSFKMKVPKKSGQN